MRKISALLLSVVLLFSLTACGDRVSDTTDTDTPDGDIVDDGGTNEETGEPSQSDETDDMSFTPVTAVDNEECSITITDIDPDDMWGYALKVTLENKSAEKTYMFSVYSGSVNGVQSDPAFAAEVAPGKKAVEEITFSADKLEEYGITQVTDIELVFNVYNSDDWSEEYVADKLAVNVYPYGEEKASAFVREPKDTDTVLVDNEYAAVIVTEYYTDEVWGYTAGLFLLNKSDKELMFTVDDVSVNGFMAEPYFASSVMPGKCEFTSISWSEDTFAESGITSVEVIEFNLRVYDNNDWTADDFVNETITLNP